MEIFDWTSFHMRIAVKASMEEVYAAWTKPSELCKWFLSKAIYQRDGKVISENEHILPEDNYAWSWFLYDVVEEGKVTETNGKDLIQFTFAETCLVEVKLSTQKEYTVILLTQNNIPTDETSKYRIRLGCESGWEFFLTNLKSVYEGGLDLRNKDPELKGMLNN